MRKWVLLSGCGLVLNVCMLAVMYGPAASDAEAFLWLPFLVAFVTLGSAFYLINGHRLGRVKGELLWQALGALPRWAQAGLVLLFAGTVAQVVFSQAGVQSEVSFERTFVTVSVWISAVGTALHYSLRRGEEPRPVGTAYRIASAVFVVVGIGLAITTFVIGRNPIEDDKAADDQLSTRFGVAAWHSHQVAANTEHGALNVYLDTRDATVQDAACTDLKPFAAEQERVPQLYYASGHHGRFSRTC